MAKMFFSKPLGNQNIKLPEDIKSGKPREEREIEHCKYCKGTYSYGSRAVSSSISADGETVVVQLYNDSGDEVVTVDVKIKKMRKAEDKLLKISQLLGNFMSDIKSHEDICHAREED